MARPRIHDDSLRHRLMDDAARLIGAHGAARLTLRELAGQAGTSTTAVYSLFGGKPDLLAALHRAAFADFGAAQQAVPVTADPTADLLALAHAYRDWAMEHPHWYAVMFGGAVDGLLPDDFDLAHCVPAITPLNEAVGRFLDSPAALPGADLPVVASSLWSVVHGFVSLELGQLLDPVARAGDDTFDACARASLRGWSQP